MNTKLAVVILNWNGSEMMKHFLPSVVEYSAVEGVRIIVADNHSDDDSLQMLQEYFPTVGIIQLDRNYGFADGYNHALAQVEAKYYLLLNSDVEVTPHWLEPMLQYMDTHPNVAACQPKLLAFREKERTGKDVFEYAGGCGGFIDRYGYPFCRGRVMDTVEADHGQYDDIRTLFWATGAALMVRSTDYHEIGGLDGRFFAHMEEIDFCWRLRSRGRGIVCISESKVYHVGGATLNKENPRKTYLNFRNNLYMLYKNLPADEFRPVMCIRRLLDYLAALSFLLKGETGNFKAVFKARKDFAKAKRDFRPDRERNLQQACLSPIPERMRQSLLWQYYAHGRKTFASLQVFLPMPVSIPRYEKEE